MNAARTNIELGDLGTRSDINSPQKANAAATCERVRAFENPLERVDVQPLN
jgi:hypothetical protein